MNYLKWGILEFATFLCMRWVSANLRWGNLGFATFYVYGWVQTANLKWETSDLQHFVCVCVCVFVCANFKREMGNLGFATFYVCIWVGTKLQA